MGKIFYLMGKSAAGKDTVYKRLKEKCPELKTIVLYTTRPMREGETDGVEYHFISEDVLDGFKAAGKIIEMRTYQTVFGPWSYATVDDGSIDMASESYLAIGTLESYKKLRIYFGGDRVVPIYIAVDDGIRLERALHRERQQREPKYAELCRRFLADEEDFSDGNRADCGIEREYRNDELDCCVEEIIRDIRKEEGRQTAGTES